MRAWMLGTALLALNGCVIYASDGNDPWDDDDFWNSDGDTAEDPDTDVDSDSDSDTAAPDPTSSFSLTPSEVEVGDTTLVTITSSDGFDFSHIAEVHIDGPLVVHDVLVRPDEVNVVLTVNNDAVVGTTAAVWVVLDDGTAWLLDTTLTVATPDDNPCD